MKKLYVFPIAAFLVGTFIYSKNTNIEKEKPIVDNEAPIIEVLDDDLLFFDDEEINFFDYIKVSDNSGAYSINILDEEHSKDLGEKTIIFEAKDLNKNTSRASINVRIISLDDFLENVKVSTYNYAYRRPSNDEFLEEKGPANYDAFELAKEFIGMGGGCNEVAQAYINAYFGEGYNVFDTHDVSYEEAMPGDIIYYTNGGTGFQHYAVYLGGSSALQGNINGTTVIGNVYMSHGSTPQFKRLNGR